jgi:signal transduction histidine kinase
MRRSFLFVRNGWAVVFAAVIILMVVSHLIAFVVFSQYSRHTQLEVNRGIIARQIITLIEAVEINPPGKRELVVNAIDIPNISITMNHSPHFKLRVSKLAIWNILLKIHQIPDSERTLQLSVRFDDDKWLNISASILQSSWNSQIILFIFEFLIVMALFFVAWSLSRYNRPLKQFIQQIERMGRRLKVVKMQEEGPVMVREAAKAINKMQERMEELLDNRTQMMAAISHDLRTPITRLKLRAQFLEDKTQQQQFMDDLDEMESMISQSLKYFKDEQANMMRSKFDLAALMVLICSKYQETGQSLTYVGPKHGGNYQGDLIGLRRALNNIIDNALKYGTQAKVVLVKLKKKYVIAVEDDGPGIDEADIQKVFLPFYRGENSRCRTTGGIGLGLAVARNVITAHDGEVTLETSDSGGLRVVITLPSKP